MSLRAGEGPQQTPTCPGHSGPAVSLQPDQMPVQPSASGCEGPQPQGALGTFGAPRALPSVPASTSVFRGLSHDGHPSFTFCKSTKNEKTLMCKLHRFSGTLASWAAQCHGLPASLPLGLGRPPPSTRLLSGARGVAARGCWPQPRVRSPSCVNIVTNHPYLSALKSAPKVKIQA